MDLSTLFQLRVFVSFLLLFTCGVGKVQAAEAPLRGDGVIRLYNYHLNEFAEIRFRSEETLNATALEKIHHLLRSRDNHQQKAVPLTLIDLIDYLQDKFNADTIEIISAYRSPELNKELRRNGHAVSPVSLHISGQALDIHIDEIREETLRDYLLTLKVGGVGYYGPFDFVHIDTGPIRHWGEEISSQRKLIGVLQPDAPRQLTSDRNEYLPGAQLSFTWQVPPNSSTTTEGTAITDMQLEHFHRGRWQVVARESRPLTETHFTLPYDDGRFKNKMGQIRHGKYRWIFRQSGEEIPSSSNEFYLKKS